MKKNLLSILMLLLLAQFSAMRGDAQTVAWNHTNRGSTNDATWVTYPDSPVQVYRLSDTPLRKGEWKWRDDIQFYRLSSRNQTTNKEYFFVAQPGEPNLLGATAFVQAGELTGTDYDLWMCVLVGFGGGYDTYAWVNKGAFKQEGGVYYPVAIKELGNDKRLVTRHFGYNNSEDWKDSYWMATMSDNKKTQLHPSGYPKEVKRAMIQMRSKGGGNNIYYEQGFMVHTKADVWIDIYPVEKDNNSDAKRINSPGRMRAESLEQAYGLLGGLVKNKYNQAVIDAHKAKIEEAKNGIVTEEQWNLFWSETWRGQSELAEAEGQDPQLVGKTFSLDPLQPNNLWDKGIYVRIKNAHYSLYAKNLRNEPRVLTADGTTPKWEQISNYDKGTVPDKYIWKLWRTIGNDGNYLWHLQNVATGQELDDHNAMISGSSESNLIGPFQSNPDEFGGFWRLAFGMTQSLNYGLEPEFSDLHPVEINIEGNTSGNITHWKRGQFFSYYDMPIHWIMQWDDYKKRLAPENWEAMSLDEQRLVINRYTDHVSSASNWLMEATLPKTYFDELIPFLNSENKAGGYTTEQLAKLKAAYEIYKNDGGDEAYVNSINTIIEELGELKTQQRLPALQDGYYRIKNAHQKLFINGYPDQVLTQESSDPTKTGWQKADGTHNDIWRVESKDGKYILTNVATGYTIQTVAESNNSEIKAKGDAATANIELVNESKYPGHYTIMYGESTIHGAEHGNGDLDNQGETFRNLADWRTNDGDLPYNFVKQSNNEVLHGSSVWLFEPVAMSNELTDEEKIAANVLLTAENVVRGYTTEQLKPLRDAIAVYSSYTLKISDPVKAQIKALQDMTLEERIKFNPNAYYLVITGDHKSYRDEFEPLSETNKNKNPLLYADDMDRVRWHEQGTSLSAEELWKVDLKEAENKLSLVNMGAIKAIRSYMAARALAGVDAYTVAPKETDLFIDNAKLPARLVLTYNGVDSNPNYINALNLVSKTEDAIGGWGYNDPTDPALDYQKPSTGTYYSRPSTWMLRELKDSEIPTQPTARQKDILKHYVASEGAVGGYSASEPMTTAKRVSSQGDALAKNVFEAVFGVIKNSRKIEMVDGLYRIKSANDLMTGDPAYIYVNYGSSKTIDPSTWSAEWYKSADRTKVEQLWQVTATAGKYTIVNPNTQTALASATGSLSDNTTSDLAFIGEDNFPAIMTLKVNDQYVHLSGWSTNNNGTLMSYQKDEVLNPEYHYLYFEDNTDGTTQETKTAINKASSYYLIPVTSIDVKLNKKYASFCFPFAVTLPDALNNWAYSPEKNGQTIKDKTILVTPLASKEVPANKPVVIESSEDGKTFTLNINKDNHESVNASTLVFKGVTAPNRKAQTGDFILRTSGVETPGFYKANVDSRIAPNKVYVSADPTGVIKSLILVRATPTGIEEVEVTSSLDANEIYYDLQGNRVINPTSGIYVTASGRKVLLSE